MKNTRTWSIFAILAIIILGLGVFLGYGLGKEGPETTFTLDIENDSTYPYLRPLIGVQTNKAETALAPLQNQIKQVAASMPAGSLTRYSYYFRDLTTAQWTGINETDQYDPASMLKVVVALAVYKQEEETPGFLEKNLTYTQDLANINAAFPFAPPIALKVGQSYSVSFLLQEMLSDSDNAAKDLLLSAIDQSVLDKIYTDLSIPKPNDEDSAGYTISPLQYSRFFRILYYSTYDLSWNYSNELLKLLTQSTFTSGLVSGVPNTVSVAHKYGEHVIGGEDGKVDGVELSDCGIVYDPLHPYLICVMTEGADPLQLSNFIAKASQATYNFVNALP